MNVQVWKQLSTLLGVTLFALLIALLTRPWLHALAGSLGDHWHRSGFLLWQLLVVITAVLVGGVWRQRKRPLFMRVLTVAAFFAAHGLAVYALGFNLWLHVPLLLFLVILSLRFWLYYTVVEFPVDFALATLAVLLTLMLEARIPITMTILDVVIFFGSGFSLILLFHVRDMEREGFKPPYPLLMVVMSLFVLFVLVVGAAGGIPMGVEITQAILAGLRLLWAGISQLILWMLYPIVMLLGPIFEWLTGLIPEGEPQQEEESVLTQNGFMEELEGTAPTASTWSVPDWVYWVLGILVLLAILVFVLRRLDISAEEDTEGVEEERASVFSTDALRRDASAVLGAWKRRLDRLRRPNGPTDDPIARIRWSYKQFLHRMRLLAPREPHVTPGSYEQRLRNDAGSEAALRQLTTNYEEARYALRAENADAEAAEAALDQLKQHWKRSKSAKQQE